MVERIGLERGIDPVNASTNSKGYSPDSFKTGIPITGPSAGVATSPKTPGSSLNGASCPLDLTTGPKGDIRDIRGPIHIPDPRLWLFYALGGILLALLAWAAWKWFGKRQVIAGQRRLLKLLLKNWKRPKP